MNLFLHSTEATFLGQLLQQTQFSLPIFLICSEIQLTAHMQLPSAFFPFSPQRGGSGGVRSQRVLLCSLAALTWS